jgi:hypothetical protein
MFTCHEHVWEMFKELKADCRRLPVRRGQPEPVVEAKTQAVAEPAPLPEIKEIRRPKKKPRRQPAPTPIIEEPVELYDYPFVERLIEEPAAPAAEEPSEFHEYSFDLPAVEYRIESTKEDNALAYIVSADDEPPHLVLDRQARRNASAYQGGEHVRARRA